MKQCFIFFDDKNFRLSNPDNNYSIQNLPGLPFKITWDNNSEHIINNPDNYSYQIIGNFTWNYTGIFRDGRFSWSCYRWFNPPLGQSFSGNYYTTETGYNLNCIPTNEIGVLRAFNSSNVQTFSDFFKVNDGIILMSSSNTQIKITDNNITYEYPINNINSVNIVNSVGEKNIIIENQSFSLIDENSVYKQCNDVCPKNTVTCDCGNVRCCYEKLSNGKGYKLVKKINL
jgi:hypothetical protein